MPERALNGRPIDRRLVGDVARINEPAIVTDVVDRLVAARVEDLCARYELGQLVHQRRYDCSTSLCPVKGVMPLAAVAGMAPSTLRRYARVSEVIRPGEFRAIVQLRGPNRLPLSWSHIEELAECRNSKLRLQCATDAVAESLGVGALRNRLRLATRP